MANIHTAIHAARPDVRRRQPPLPDRLTPEETPMERWILPFAVCAAPEPLGTVTVSRPVEGLGTVTATTRFWDHSGLMCRRCAREDCTRIRNGDGWLCTRIDAGPAVGHGA